MKSLVVAASAVFLVLTMSLWALQSSDERRGWIQVGGDDQPITQGTFRVADVEDGHQASQAAAVIFSPFNCSEAEVRIPLKSGIEWHSSTAGFIESASGSITGEIEPTTVRPVMRCPGQ
jgi:hypothetical protein